MSKMEDGIDRCESTSTRGMRDSVTIPTIFVSPCNSGQDIAATQSAMILQKAREIAMDIIHKAIELHHGMDVTDSYESALDLGGSDVGLSATESQFLFEARDLVQDIIERALEISQADAIMNTDAMVDSEAVMAVFEAVDPEKGLTPVQSQVFFKAKEMVHDAVGRATIISSGINAMNTMEASPASESSGGFRRIHSDMLAARAQDIVDKVVRRAIKLNLEMMESRAQEQAEVGAGGGEGGGGGGVGMGGASSSSDAEAVAKTTHPKKRGMKCITLICRAELVRAVRITIVVRPVDKCTSN